MVCLKKKKILYFILAAILICGCKQEAPLTFQAGTYEVTAQGHNGDIRLSVTFSDSCITDIQVLEQHETPHIGDIVFDELILQIIKANGTGIDAMTGATVTSRALMKGVTEAANMAKVSDGEQFKKATLPKAEQQPVEGIWDVVIVGAGGAGLAAAAEAAQQGNTVLVIEKNAEIGGNTLVSGGIFQSVMPYLVWEPAKPDAKTGVGYDGKTYAAGRRPRHGTEGGGFFDGYGLDTADAAVVYRLWQSRLRQRVGCRVYQSQNRTALCGRVAGA